MPRRPKWHWLLLSLLLWGGLAPAHAARAVVNAELSNEEIKDRTDLRAVFTLRKRLWANGQAIKVYVLPDDAEVHQEFVRSKLHLFPYQLRHIWNRLVFSGTGVAPIELDTEAEVLEAVGSDPSAIGYVNTNSLPATVKEVPVVIEPEIVEESTGE
ncbi:MAG: hypothetical protein ACPHER_08055 [Nevskiales bacterium]